MERQFKKGWGSRFSAIRTGLILSFISVYFTGLSAHPNIVLIVSDDQAYQAIGAYGNSFAQTPNIDRLARQGALFQKAYVTNSVCGPSRARILTGKYSHINGVKDNENSTFDFSQNNFAKVLQAAGYQTAWIGKMHLGNSTPQGFNYYSILPDQGHYYNPDFIQTGNIKKRYTGYVSDIITDLSTQWLEQRDKQKPFCIAIGHKATHRTWMPDLQDLGKFDNTTFTLPEHFYDTYDSRKAASVQDMTIAKAMRLAYDLKIYRAKDSSDIDQNIRRMTSEQKDKWLSYYGKIKNELETKKIAGNELTEWKYQRYMKDYLATGLSLDRNIGKTLDYLDQHGLTKNTLVIYMSDQGFYLGEHGWFDKRWMYKESFRTPMLMRFPGVVKQGVVVNDFAMNIDIAPTLIEAAGAKLPAGIQGVSLLPLFKNNKKDWRRELYYHYYENGQHAVSPHFGIRTSRYKLIRFYKRLEGWELFDLQKDPHEMHNIYNDKKAAGVVVSLKNKLKLLIDQYEDQKAALIFNTEI